MYAFNLYKCFVFVCLLNINSHYRIQQLRNKSRKFILSLEYEFCTSTDYLG